MGTTLYWILGIFVIVLLSVLGVWGIVSTRQNDNVIDESDDEDDRDACSGCLHYGQCGEVTEEENVRRRQNTGSKDGIGRACSSYVTDPMFDSFIDFTNPANPLSPVNVWARSSEQPNDQPNIDDDGFVDTDGINDNDGVPDSYDQPDSYSESSYSGSGNSCSDSSSYISSSYESSSYTSSSYDSGGYDSGGGGCDCGGGCD